MSRPEHVNPPDLFYNEFEAQKYAVNSRMMSVQTTLTDRALDLLGVGAGLLLDVGCGSGLSGEAISERGYEWVGVDISPAMIAVARAREVDGDLLCVDIGDGLPFKPNVFDGAISVSVLQWLCQSDRAVDEPRARLLRFFTAVRRVLKADAPFVAQFYPESTAQCELITNAATAAGLAGGLTVDYPNSAKARKYFLLRPRWRRAVSLSCASRLRCRQR